MMYTNDKDNGEASQNNLMMAPSFPQPMIEPPFYNWQTN